MKNRYQTAWQHGNTLPLQLLMSCTPLSPPSEGRLCYITHILVNLWGSPGGMTEKEFTSLCYLSIFARIFPTFSAVHFLAFAFLAIYVLVQRIRHNRNRRPKAL